MCIVYDANTQHGKVQFDNQNRSYFRVFRPYCQAVSGTRNVTMRAKENIMKTLPKFPFVRLIHLHADHGQIRIADFVNIPMRLGKKPYKFVKTLYFAKKRQATITEIENEVWGETTDNTIQVTASNLRKKLDEQNFPDTIVNVVNQYWKELEFPTENNNNSIPIRSAIISFTMILK